MPGSSGTVSPSGVFSISTWSEAAGPANAGGAARVINKRKGVRIAFNVISP